MNYVHMCKTMTVELLVSETYELPSQFSW